MRKGATLSHTTVCIWIQHFLLIHAFFLEGYNIPAKCSNILTFSTNNSFPMKSNHGHFKWLLHLPKSLSAGCTKKERFPFLSLFPPRISSIVTLQVINSCLILHLIITKLFIKTDTVNQFLVKKISPASASHSGLPLNMSCFSDLFSFQSVRSRDSMASLQRNISARSCCSEHCCPHKHIPVT